MSIKTKVALFKDLMLIEGQKDIKSTFSIGKEVRVSIKALHYESRPFLENCILVDQNCTLIH